MLGKVEIKETVIENYPLLSVLIGFVLVSLSIGPYQNGDTAWELDAVSGIMNYGLPYTNGFYLMDQPPLGFYIQAVNFQLFGLSINNGTFLVTVFGLGCIALVYGIGRTVYNKTTGFFAALLFAFSPWHLILSRTFLIDVLCLFFSLFSLLVAVMAMHRRSLKLFVASGFIFAAAFNTKLYAVFTLIPLILYFFYIRPVNVKRSVIWIAAFALPVLLFSFLWYQTISGLGMTSITGHADFLVNNPVSIVPSYFFVPNFLATYGLGWFFIDAAILSLLVGLIWRRFFGKFLFFDLVCLSVILLILGIDTYLGAALNLKAPYLNAIKYDYHTLPLFSFLAASLVTKSLSLFSISKAKKRASKIAFTLMASAGLVLVASAVFYNMDYLNLFSTWNYLIFRVEPNVNFGYSLFNSAPIDTDSPLMAVQYLGFAIATSGLVWAGRRKIGWLREVIRRQSQGSVM